MSFKIEFSDEQKSMLRKLADEKASYSERYGVYMSLSASLSELLMQSRPLDTFVRDIYSVRTTPGTGSLKFPIAPNEPVAWSLAKIGTIPRNFLEGDQIEIPVDVYGTRVSFSMDYLRDTNYDWIGYATGQIQTAISREEERTGWALLRWAANNGTAITWPNVTYTTRRIQVATANPGAGYFSKQLFSAGLQYFEKRGFGRPKIYGPAEMMRDIRGWAQTTIDDATGREIFTKGGLDSIWNMQFTTVPEMEIYEAIGDRKADTPTRVNRLLDMTDTLTSGADAWSGAQQALYAAGNLQVAYMVGDDVGILGVRDPLTVYPDNTLMNEWQIGWGARERVGFGIYDVRKVVMLIVDRTATES